MARAVGLMDPANAIKSAGPFREGYVRIDSSTYKVHKGKDGDTEPAIPATKWVWGVTRLTSDGTEPLVDEHDEPITEEIFFSFGGKSLPFVHPGKADGPDDEEPEDEGTSVGAEGNTIFLVANDWAPNEKSGLMVLTTSLVAAQIKPEYLNRCWAPDWVGCVFEMKAKKGEKGADGREFSYKVVSKVLVGPGGKKSKGGTASGPNPTTVLAPIVQVLAQELDGQSMTRKAFLNRIRTAMETANVDSKLLVPVLSLLKDDKWLNEHAETFDYKLDASSNSIVFGNVPF